MERTNEGRQEAKLKGVRFIHRRTLDRGYVLSLYRQGIGVSGISRQLRIARSTVYKVLDDMNFLNSIK